MSKYYCFRWILICAYVAYPVMNYPHLCYYIQEGLRRTIESYPHLRANAKTKVDGTTTGKLLICSEKRVSVFSFSHKILLRWWCIHVHVLRISIYVMKAWLVLNQNSLLVILKAKNRKLAANNSWSREEISFCMDSFVFLFCPLTTYNTLDCFLQHSESYAITCESLALNLRWLY